MNRTISLNGVWTYTPQAHVTLKPGSIFEEDTQNLPSGGEMTLPTNWQLGGLDNFHGRVKFERTFNFDGLQQHEDSLWLIFRAVDYYAKVWLNGTLLGEHEGYFQPFSFDVTQLVKAGQNTLTVEVNCPKEEPGTVWPNNKIMLKGILSHWDCRPGSWDLKTGQDQNSGGIWHDVYLEARPQAYVDYTRVTTKVLADDVPAIFGFGIEIDLEPLPKQAQVTVDCDVVGPPGAYTLKVTVGGVTEVQPIALKRSGERHSVIVRVPNPKLWWTWDIGEPHMETCDIQVVKDGKSISQKQIRVGLREIHFDPSKGEWWLNGKRFFVRGTSVVPTLWLSEYDKKMITTDIGMLKDAHINGVRVCVHINRDEFYTACDEAGIIVWQDFAFQWGYTATHEFTQECSRQIREMVRLLVNHPSVALWCCQNESGVYNHHVLAPMMADAIAAEDTSRFIHPVCEVGEHTYHGWYFGDYHEYISLPATPILSEFGAQALPDVESVKEMAGEAWPPNWDALGFHDFQYHQTFHVAGVEMGNNWEEFVQNSQGYQARLLKYSLELYRRAKYEKLGGLFQFMFMDCWPSVTWAVVGYNRVPKQGYHVLKQCLQPVLIGISQQNLKVLVGPARYWVSFPLTLNPWVVNDYHRAYTDCSYQVTLTGPGGTFTFTPEGTFDIPADSVMKKSVPVTTALPDDLATGDYELALELKHGTQVISKNTYTIEIVNIPG